MCDYCDCRSHPYIAALSAEHEVMLTLLADLERAVGAADAATATSVTARLDDLLAPHATKEERGVFAELRRSEVDDGYLGRFEDEHRVIQALSAGRADQPWEASARALVQQLRDHIFREETDLFPAAHQVLAPAQWDAVDAATTP